MFNAPGPQHALGGEAPKQLPGLTLAGAGPMVFYIRAGRMGWVRPPRRFAPNGASASRKKNERVRRYETQRLVPDFKVLGQPVTSEVRSSAPRYGSVFGE